jgi:hypothetical protein
MRFLGILGLGLSILLASCATSSYPPCLPETVEIISTVEVTAHMTVARMIEVPITVVITASPSPTPEATSTPETR